MAGKLIIFSAPSGSGKSTIINYLLTQNLRLRFSISATSRAPRGTEKNGVEYYFLSPEEFRARIAAGDFLEYEEVYTDKFYGTLKSEVERILAEGDNVIFDVDVVGGCSIKKYYGDRALSMFIQPPSIEELRRRLVGRATDAPEVIEMLESFGIPVMIEQSSYESHPLGRVEWVKFWGALTGKEEQARELFDRQKAIVDQVTAEEKTDKTVAFFYITSNGLVQVRQGSDYVPKMIDLAGGRYIFPDLVEDGAKRSTMNMQVEEFYNGAKDADYLIYNSSIDGGVSTVEELIDKCEVLKDFKAVREGHVFCTTNDMYQQSMAIGDMIADIHSMLSDDGKAEMNYIFPLE